MCRALTSRRKTLPIGLALPLAWTYVIRGSSPSCVKVVPPGQRARELQDNIKPVLYCISKANDAVHVSRL